MRTVLLAAAFLCAALPVKAGETFDQFRDKVNQSWYEFAVDKCQNVQREYSQREKKGFRCYLAERGYTSQPGFSQAVELRNLSRDLQEKLFFDAIVTEQAQRNTCTSDYWTAMSQAPNAEKDLTKSNQALVTQHPFLKGKLNPQVQINSNAAKEAQRTAVADMIDKAQKIIDLELQQEQIQYDHSKEGIEKMLRLEGEADLLRKSIPFAEDTSAASFFQYQVYAEMKSNRLQGYKLQPNELLDKLTGTGRDSFQNLVVRPKLALVAEEQSLLAKMNGQYADQHAFKVAAFTNGDAERLLYLGSSATPSFGSLSCQMQSKYGIGSDIAYLANTSIVSAATAFVGPAAGLVTKLAQVGAIPARTELIMSSALNGFQRVAGVGDIGMAIVNECLEGGIGKAEFSSCAAVQDIKKSSATAFLNKEMTRTSCALNAVLAAVNLRGAQKGIEQLAVRTIEVRAGELGLAKEFQSVMESVASSSVAKETRTSIENEIGTALKTATRTGHPSPQLIRALAVEDPDALLATLKEINATSGTGTWAEKVRKWLSRKKELTASESSELETCLIQGDNPVACVPQKPAPEAG